MKKGDIFEGIVEGVRFPNKGYVIVDGQVVVLKNSVPGQRVRFLISKKKGKKLEGRILEVLEKGADEKDKADCQYYGQCGGCLYRTLPYEKQLEIKANQVRDLLEPVMEGGGQVYIKPGSDSMPNIPVNLTHWDNVFEGIIPSPHEIAYRNKMEFTFGDEIKDGPLALGMHKRGSFYDIVTVKGCRIMSEDFSKILETTLDFFSERQIPYYHRLRHEGYLRHMVLRRGENTGENFVCLVTASPEGAHLDASKEAELLNEWKDEIAALSPELHDRLIGIVHTRNDSLADAVIDEGTEVLYGEDHFSENLLGLSFKISPFSFFQTNSKGAEVLYEKAREYVGNLDGNTLLFDLYSGTGTIAQMMAPAVKKVIGVEIVEEAVKAARENAALNGLSNCEFIAGDVLKVLDNIEEKPDYLIIDPPRDGIHPKALKKIISYGVENMVYISCKPTSLARDLAPLMEAGYRVQKLCCVDMFPATGNVETVCLLSNTRKKREV